MLQTDEVRTFLTRIQHFWMLVSNDLREKMFGSYLGAAWIFLSPAFYVLILWFVFQYGFKVMPVSGVPFVVWFVVGYWPWLFLSDAIASGTTSILEKSYLIRKVRFDIEWVPLVKLASASFIHGILGVVVLAIVFNSQTVLTGQIFFLAYYSLAAVSLVYGIIFLTSALVVFVKDIQKIVEIGLQIGFWVTPVFWQISLVPQAYQWAFKLNPLFFIIEGYRASFMAPLVQHPGVWWTLYFWAFVAGVVLLGRYTFRKLRPQFADVL